VTSPNRAPCGNLTPHDQHPLNGGVDFADQGWCPGVPNLTEPAAQQPLSPGSEPCTSLRDAVAERMTTRWRERARSGVEDTPEGHCVDLANMVVGLLGELAAESVCDRRRCLLDDQPWNRHQPRRGGGR
jgi:hypothetical protein